MYVVGMYKTIIQSQVEHLKRKGKLMNEKYVNPQLKFELCQLEQQYYYMRYEQMLMLAPTLVHQLSKEQIKEWID